MDLCRRVAKNQQALFAHSRHRHNIAPNQQESRDTVTKTKVRPPLRWQITLCQEGKRIT